MASVNKVILIGNVTRDPEIKYTPKGTAVVDLSIAINRYYTMDNGEKKEETTFVDITLWARQAEVVRDYVRKGSLIYIEGRLQLDTWEDKQTGQKRSRLRVVAEVLQLLGSRSSNNNRATPTLSHSNFESSSTGAPLPSPQPSLSSIPIPTSVASEQEENDDLPF
jgi:single-strand DNA-binding protein